MLGNNHQPLRGNKMKRHNAQNFFNYALCSLGLITVGTLVAAPCFAVTPAAYLENAQVFATGKKFQAFRVPTVDSTGKVQYYNVTVDLNVLADGKIDSTKATISSVLSPNFAANKFIPGTYTDGQYATCTITTTVLQGGRTEAAMSCKNTDGDVLQANWITGLIPGHPFELSLKDAAIDKIPGYSNYSWGKIANAYSFWNCTSFDNEIISARQIGNTLSIGNYKSDNQQDCGVNLTKK